MEFSELPPETQKTIEVLQESIKKFCRLSTKSWVKENYPDAYSFLLYFRLCTPRIRLLVIFLKILGYSVSILDAFDIITPPRFSGVINTFIPEDVPDEIHLYIALRENSELYKEIEKDHL